MASSTNEKITMFHWTLQRFRGTEGKSAAALGGEKDPLCDRQSSEGFYIDKRKGKTVWYLKTYADGPNWRKRTFLSLHCLERMNMGRTDNSTQFRFNCNVFIRNTDDEVMVSVSHKGMCVAVGERVELCSESKAGPLRNYSPAEPFTITCFLEIVPDDKDQVTLSRSSSVASLDMSERIEVPKKAPAALVRDLSTLLHEQKFGDATLTVKGKSLKVYKGILAARSPVFAAMFNTDDAKCKGEAKFEVQDLEFDVLKAIVHFAYTEEVPNLQELCTMLFAAAHKYQLNRLKDVCENAACNNVTVDNVALNLVYASIFGGKKLKVKAIEFIKNNKEAVAKSDGWKTIIEEHPKLVASLLMDFLM